MGEGRFRVSSFDTVWETVARKTKRYATTTILPFTLFAMPAMVGLMPAHAREFSVAATGLIASIRASQDNQGLPYVVVDKIDAHVFVFNEHGTLVATTAALLGLAKGDHSVPGIGDRPLAQIRPEERTTPAGRFEAEAGKNATGEHVLWIDYDAALSLHRLRDGPRQRLNQRLLTATPNDNRASYGCVTVPVPFYEDVIKTTFARGKGIVYILPETKPWQQTFNFEPAPAQVMRVSNSAIK